MQNMCCIEVLGERGTGKRLKRSCQQNNWSVREFPVFCVTYVYIVCNYSIYCIFKRFTYITFVTFYCP